MRFHLRFSFLSEKAALCSSPRKVHQVATPPKTSSKENVYMSDGYDFRMLTVVLSKAKGWSKRLCFPRFNKIGRNNQRTFLIA